MKTVGIPGFTADLSLYYGRLSYLMPPPFNDFDNKKRIRPQMMMADPDGGMGDGFLDDGGSSGGVGGGGGSSGPPCEPQCLSWCERPDGGSYCCHWLLCPIGP